MLWFRNLHPMLRVGIIIVAATLPFAIYVMLRAERLVPVEEPAPEPFPTGSPDTPLAFPFGTEPTTTSSTLPIESTTTVTTPRAAAPRPQCSDGRDNDRDRRIDLRDPGCRSSADNSEFSATATTRRAVTTRPPAIRATTPTTRPAGTGSSGSGSPGGSNSPTSN